MRAIAPLVLVVPLALTGTAAAHDSVDPLAPVPDADAETVVSLTFDDGAATQYANARPLLADHGMPATFYLNSGRLGAAGYITAEQARTLAADGHEIGGHTIDHADLPELSPEERQRQICDDRDALSELGFQVSSFAYPHGAADATTRRQVEACGYDTGRDVGGLASPGTCEDCAHAETEPPRDAYALRTPDTVDGDTTLATLKGYVTQAEDHGGGWVPLVFHHVCDPCADEAQDALSIAPRTLDRFLDWLRPRATVATVSEAAG